jgi:hypothetical protein
MRSITPDGTAGGTVAGIDTTTAVRENATTIVDMAAITTGGGEFHGSHRPPG